MRPQSYFCCTPLLVFVMLMLWGRSVGVWWCGCLPFEVVPMLTVFIIIITHWSDGKIMKFLYLCLTNNYDRPPAGRTTAWTDTVVAFVQCKYNTVIKFQHCSNDDNNINKINNNNNRSSKCRLLAYALNFPLSWLL